MGHAHSIAQSVRAANEESLPPRAAHHLLIPAALRAVQLCSILIEKMEKIKVVWHLWRRRGKSKDGTDDTYAAGDIRGGLFLGR